MRARQAKYISPKNPVFEQSRLGGVSRTEITHRPFQKRWGRSASFGGVAKNHSHSHCPPTGGHGADSQPPALPPPKRYFEKKRPALHFNASGEKSLSQSMPHPPPNGVVTVTASQSQQTVFREKTTCGAVYQRFWRHLPKNTL